MRLMKLERRTIEEIQKTTAEFFQIGIESLVGSSRKQDISQARQVSMYLCKSLTGAPLKTIGRRFGNRDHSTVIHACRQVRDKLGEDPRFEGLVSQLRGRLEGRVAA